MTAYHFPIILGQSKKERIVIIHLTDDNEDYQENRVVVVSCSQEEPLFRIPKEAKMVNSNGSIADIVVTTRGNLTISNGTTNRRIVPHEEDEFYAFTINDNVDYGFDGIIEFSYKKNRRNIYRGFLSIIRTEDKNVLKINIDLGSEATQAMFSCQDVASGLCQPIKLVEAIKRTYTKRDYRRLINPTSGTLFTQQDGDKNPYYYKTGNITFHKYIESEESASYGDLTLNEQPESDIEITEDDATFRPFINFLNVAAAGKNKNESRNIVWSKEKPYTEKLFNIKVLYANPAGVGPLCEVKWKKHSNGEERTVNTTGNIIPVLCVIYKQIITAAEKGAQQQYESFRPENIKATSVLVLVPNIYSQDNIDELLYNLNQLNNLAINNQENCRMRYDFRVISESDAAFLGVKTVAADKISNDTILQRINDDVDDEKQKDAYLIIDSGKGTTDFSIINYNPGDTNSSISSYKRGGIAGAGGAIDYVFTRIVARQIYNNSSKDPKCDKAVFVERFMEVISKLPPTTQDKAMRLIELAKKKYDVENGTIPTVCNCFPDAIIEPIMDESTITDIKYQIISSKESEWNTFEKNDWDETSLTPVEEIDKNEIASVCNMIAKETIDNIFGKTDEHITNRIDFVLMTGRSFLFKPLQSAFEKMLNEKKGIFRVNFSNWLAYRKAKYRNERENLKIDDTTLTLNMKEVSVQFYERDLGYNCNSDLCCLKSLKLINNDMKYKFKQENFWKGFTDIDDNTAYYIGYKGKSFAGRNPQGYAGGSNITDLEKMTLFPTHYDPNVNL